MRWQWAAGPPRPPKHTLGATHTPRHRTQPIRGRDSRWGAGRPSGVAPGQHAHTVWVTAFAHIIVSYGSVKPHMPLPCGSTASPTHPPHFIPCTCPLPSGPSLPLRPRTPHPPPRPPRPARPAIPCLPHLDHFLPVNQPNHLARLFGLSVCALPRVVRRSSCGPCVVA